MYWPSAESHGETGRPRARTHCVPGDVVDLYANFESVFDAKYLEVQKLTEKQLAFNEEIREGF